MTEAASRAASSRDGSWAAAGGAGPALPGRSCSAAFLKGGAIGAVSGSASFGVIGAIGWTAHTLEYWIEFALFGIAIGLLVELALVYRGRKKARWGCCRPPPPPR